MNVLVACEESQRVATAFRNKGHNAYSCDIIPCSGKHPEYHILCDCLQVLNPSWQGITVTTEDGENVFISHWDLIIAHPPCTYLTNTGAKWFDVSRYGEKAKQRYIERDKAFDFFMNFVNCDCEHIAIENPIGYMSTHYRKPDQIIQPYQFGHEVQKATCLWLKGLPKLQPTKIVGKGEFVTHPCGHRTQKWYDNATAKERSKTFPGIALAMAEQWGNIV
jgi:hypothetical protein